MRSSGVLLHITSLPSAYGIGDLGPGAYRFADFLAEAGQTYWQILPLNITHRSPYHSSSAFACNPYLISPELLVKDGLLEEKDLEHLPDLSVEKVDYDAAIAYKKGLLEKAFGNFSPDSDHQRFCEENAGWLEDFALFKALRAKLGYGWHRWPEGPRDRDPKVLEGLKDELRQEMEEQRFYQYAFHRQWSALKEYCNGKDIRIFGDLPIYLDHGSADVWAHPEIFQLDHDKRPAVVAGVPPDYFSETGQLWGNPIYDWDVLKERGFDWWLDRVARNLELFDVLRIDHFRGLVAYWEVPRGEETALNGRWVDAPARDFLAALQRHFPALPVIAEDLGHITPDVREVMEEFDIPGMKVLLFAFGGDMAENPYIPYNVPRNSVIYSGTHDTNTARGWFEEEATEAVKANLARYLGREPKADDIVGTLVRLAMASVANTCIIPMQDLLDLGAQARMNTPSTQEGNWEWRVKEEHLSGELAQKLREMTETYGRL